MPIASTAFVRDAVPRDLAARAVWPGTARSRENANIIRDADVTEAVRQNICATTADEEQDLGPVWLIDVCQM